MHERLIANGGLHDLNGCILPSTLTIRHCRYHLQVNDISRHFLGKMRLRGADELVASVELLLLSQPPIFRIPLAVF